MITGRWILNSEILNWKNMQIRTKKILHICVYLDAQLCLTLWDPMDWSQPGSSVHGDSPGKNTGLGCHALLQGISPTQGLNPGLPHCRRILYQLSYRETCNCICILNPNKQFLHHIGDSQRVGGWQWIYILCLRRKNKVAELELLWWAEFSDGPQDSCP